MNIKDIINSNQLKGIKNYLSENEEITLEAANVAAQQRKQELKVKQSIKNREAKIREYKAAEHRSRKYLNRIQEYLTNILQSESPQLRNKLFELPGLSKYKKPFEKIEQQKNINITIVPSCAEKMNNYLNNIFVSKIITDIQHGTIDINII